MVDEPKSSISAMLKAIGKKYGEGAAMFYGDCERIAVERISTGLPSLDLILGGGIPEGRILEIYGPSSSGKTTLAIKFLAEVQKAYPEKKVAFIDVEHALDPEYAAVLGLDMENLIFSQPNSAEEALGVMQMLCASGEVKAIILDSVAKLTPRKELEGDIGDAEMAGRARLMSQGLRVITPLASDNKCTCFFINQVRSNVGQMYGNPETRPGGQALPFDSSIIIRTSFKQVDELTGETTMMIKKNKVGRPFGKTVVKIAYGEGYDVLDDTITAAKNMKVITQGGAFYSFQDKKWQGEANMRKEIADDVKLQVAIKKAIKDSMLNEELIEKKKK